jgi:ribosomal-protein-alanine N-acetyltransferase
MIVRGWRYSDILRISEIEKECFTTEAWSFGMLASSYESENFRGVVVDDGGDIAGYGGITIACDSADIDNIAVTEAYRHSGVATAIIEKLCEIAKADGVEKLFLEVRVSNVPAMRLYLKCGFKGSYARTRYYPDGEDCLVMTKVL